MTPETVRSLAKRDACARKATRGTKQKSVSQLINATHLLSVVSCLDNFMLQNLT